MNRGDFLSKNLLDKILILSEVADIIGTTESNILDLIKRERIPQSYYRLKKSKRKKRGVYIFDESIIEYHEKNLKVIK